MALNTIPANAWPPSSEQMGGSSGSQYELPIASADTLGGVKVGNGLSMNAETGVLSNPNPTPYSLPTAGADTLGGVKVGNGLSMNAETGVLSANRQIVDYSTTEQATGQKWIDGKDIYTKTIVFENISAAQSSDPVVIAGMDSIVKFEGLMVLSDRIVPLPYVDNAATYQRSVIYLATGLVISGYANSPAVTTAYVTVYYTKTTT